MRYFLKFLWSCKLLPPDAEVVVPFFDRVPCESFLTMNLVFGEWCGLFISYYFDFLPLPVCGTLMEFTFSIGLSLCTAESRISSLVSFF